MIEASGTDMLLNLARRVERCITGTVPTAQFLRQYTGLGQLEVIENLLFGKTVSCSENRPY